MDPHVAANRALWEEWTPTHVRSAFYDVEGWKSGRRPDLHPLLVEEVDDDETATELRLRYHYWPRPEPLAFDDIKATKP